MGFHYVYHTIIAALLLLRVGRYKARCRPEDGSAGMMRAALGSEKAGAFAGRLAAGGSGRSAPETAPGQAWEMQTRSFVY